MNRPCLKIVFALPVVTALCISSLAYADEGDASIRGGDSVLLADLIDQAMEENPQILAARERRDAAKAAILRAWDLKNPQASYEFMGEDLQTRIGPQEQKYGISQMIPFPTKLPLRTKVAQIAEKIAAHFILHTRQMVRTQIIKAYADLVSAQMQLSIFEGQKQLLIQMASNVRSGVATGDKSASDAAKIEAEIARITEKMLKTELMRTEAEERLNVTLGSRQSSGWPKLKDIPLPELPIESEELKTLALRHRHGLIIKRLLLDQEDAKVALAKMEYLPDFEVGFNYVEIGSGTTTRADDGLDAWSIPFKVSIPLWEPQLRGRVQEAEYTKRSVERDLENMQNETLASLSEAYTRFRTAQDRVLVYQATWIPQAEQAYSSVLSGFEGGEAGILDALDALRMKLEAHIGYWQSYADTLAAHAMIEQVIGFSMDEVRSVSLHEDHIAKKYGEPRS